MHVIQGKDTLADLQSCLYYYENVAESDGDARRASEIQTNAEKLKRVIEKIKEEVKCALLVLSPEACRSCLASTSDRRRD